VPSEIALRRLASQRLVGPRAAAPAEVVRWSGAVQAQDYPAAKWAVGQRTESADDARLDADFNAGAIPRTHMLRPTWHFVAPEDVRWIQELTGPRVHTANAFIYRQQELDQRLLKSTDQLLAGWLSGGTFLTRNEVAQRLGEAGIPAASIRLAYIVMHAELEAVVCSGPLRGRQHTYALLDERVPEAVPRSREGALAELALRYFTSHGPAQLQDFAWWSGLTLREVREAVDLAGARLEREELAGKSYWSGPSTAGPIARQPSAHLLPNYDEYFIALRDRSAFFDPARLRVDAAPEGAFDRHLVVAGGDVVGGWRSVRERSTVTVSTTLLAPLDEGESEALTAEVDRYGRFLGLHPRAVAEAGPKRGTR
jgi:hypothetical protein